MDKAPSAVRRKVAGIVGNPDALSQCGHLLACHRVITVAMHVPQFALSQNTARPPILWASQRLAAWLARGKVGERK